MKEPTRTRVAPQVIALCLCLGAFAPLAATDSLECDGDGIGVRAHAGSEGDVAHISVYRGGETVVELDATQLETGLVDWDTQTLEVWSKPQGETEDVLEIRTRDETITLRWRRIEVELTCDWSR